MKTIKVMTFNIQHGKDYIKKDINLKLMSDVIKEENADIVCLNEVRGEGPHPDYCNQTKIIADYLNYYGYFGQAIEFQNGKYGNAIVSRYPFKKVETIAIPDPEIKDEDTLYETRCLIKAEFEDPNLVVLATHFGLANSEQENALNVVKEEISKCHLPLVFMGDLNMKPDNKRIMEISRILIDTATVFDGEKLTFPSIEPNRKIDYIFVSKDIEIVSADIPNKVASDHLPHTAVIKLNK